MKLVRLDRDPHTETWLTRGRSDAALREAHALRVARNAFWNHSTQSALIRAVAELAMSRGRVPDSAPEAWSKLASALTLGHFGVEVFARPAPRIDGRPGNVVPAAPHPPTPPSKPEPIIDDDRALRILRCDPRLVGDEQPLRFEYLLRELAGKSVLLRIVSESFPGKLVHERSLTAAETRDRVHSGTWDGRVTAAGEFSGRRLPARFGPCTLELVHDATYRDSARFSLARSGDIERLRLAGCFHVGSAFLLPTLDASYATARNQSFRFNFDPEESDLDPIPDVEVEPEAHPRWSATLPFLRAILWHLHADSGLQLCVAGHSDPLGSDKDNQELSNLRAECVLALLEGDEQAFVGILEATSVPEDDPIFLGFAEQTMHWQCAPPSPSPTAKQRKYAIGCFQALHNLEFDPKLEVDGEIGPKTRAGYFRVYQEALRRWVGGASALEKLRAALRFVASGKLLACGETVPPSAGSDGARRIEALFLVPGGEITDIESVEHAYFSGVEIHDRKVDDIPPRDLDLDPTGPPNHEQREVQTREDDDGLVLERAHEHVKRDRPYYFLRLLADRGKSQ